MASIKTNNNLSLFDEDEKNNIEEAEIVEVTEPVNGNQNLLEDKTDKEEDNPDEVDKTDEVEKEKPKKRGRKPKNQNRDEE